MRLPVVAACLLALPLAACGGSDSTSTPPTTSPTSTAPVSTTPTTATTEGRPSVKEWLSTVRSQTSHWDTQQGFLVVNQAHIVCNELQNGVSVQRAASMLQSSGVSKSDAGAFVASAAAAFCPDATP